MKAPEPARRKDDSDKTRTESALELMSRLIERTSLIACGTDRQGNLVHLSRNAERILGYPLDTWLHSSFFAEALHPEDRERVLAMIRIVLKEHASRQIDLRIRASNQRYLWFRFELAWAGDLLDESLAAMGQLVNITTYKKKERLILEHEAKLDLMMETSFAGFAIHDRRRIYEFNPHLLTMFGYTTAELIGLPLHQLVSPNDRELFDTRVREARSEIFSARGRRRDGTEFALEYRAQALNQGERMIAAIAFRDVSHSTKVQDELRRTSDRQKRLSEQTQRRAAELQAVLDNMSDGVIVCDHEGRVTLVNKFGRQLEESKGSTFTLRIPNENHSRVYDQDTTQDDSSDRRRSGNSESAGAFSGIGRLPRHPGLERERGAGKDLDGPTRPDPARHENAGHGRMAVQPGVSSTLR